MEHYKDIELFLQSWEQQPNQLCCKEKLFKVLEMLDEKGLREDTEVLLLLQSCLLTDKLVEGKESFSTAVDVERHVVGSKT